ncbi:PLP-dependent aminotransferase family protein [Neobacillus mesonae]|nr:PLP-dependent aminotransferase family protein [Neobacillus mesonae]
MFDILLPDQSEIPLYQQLYLLIRDGIRQGSLADGQRLPSVRSLQNQLNISKTPIETAYQMLMAEGYVFSKPRSGLYVVNRSNGQTNRNLYQEPRQQTIHKTKQELERSSQSVKIDFYPTALDPVFFPVRVWNKLLKESVDQHLNEIGDYGDPQGEYGLRSVISEYLLNSRGVHSTPEQIIVGAGTAPSLGSLSKLLKDIKNIAFEEPGYSLVREQFRMNGFNIINIPVGEHGISLDVLEKSQADLVYVTPSHQFPTGGIMPYPERERLLAWAEDNNAYIIEDDYDGEFRYQGKPISSLQSLDRNERVIYAGTFSKVLTPSLRMNYLVLPSHLMHELSEGKQNVFFAPSRIEQWAMESFILQGHWYRHIRKMRNVYRKRHQHLIEIIQTYLGGHVEISGQYSGLHIQLTVRTSKSSEELIQLAAEKGVKLYDLRKMWVSQQQTSGAYPRLYIGFAALSTEDMELGIKLLSQAWSLELN